MQSSGEPPPAGRADGAVCVAAPAIDGSWTACSPIRLPEQGGVGDQALAVGRVPHMRRELPGIDNHPVDLHEPRPWVICQQLPPAEVWVVVAKSQRVADDPGLPVEVLGTEVVGEADDKPDL